MHSHTTVWRATCARAARALLLFGHFSLACACHQRRAGAAMVQAQTAGVAIRLVHDEADASLVIVQRHERRQQVGNLEWRALFTSAGYRALAARDSTFGVLRDDSAFARFLLRDSLAARVGELAQRVHDMEELDVTRPARQALSYAPANARIDATIFPVVKPQPNSFVFGPDTAPQLFLFVNVDETPTHFVNRLTHELHHVALNTACANDPAPSLPQPVHALVRNLGAFGEGLAMLAAAGSPDVDANSASDAATRARWDADVRDYPRQFAAIEDFVRAVVDGHITTRDSVRAVAQTLYGAQGPWYVVGWKMAATIERQLGRPALIAAMCDPRILMATFNRAAARANASGDSLPTWNENLLNALAGPTR
jgi:hypothetical protein